uniref:Chitin-binding type-4 domain-containing protein n=1 Tax=Globisporangium ultimum (strain ATCC 200006 / CBS 805.95 / DAOM BR144) TaxID=431595 RepID=K3WC37_GLOUD
MKFLTSAVSAATLFALGSFTQVDAHSWLTKPVSRETGSRADIEGKIGCPSNTPGQTTSFKAGETIDVRYWRNNHLGGFIRWSIAKRGEESKEVFDKNAFYYTCRESGPTCLPKGTNTRYAGDSSGDNTISCGDKIVLPDWLQTGDYVLQWTWFGAGSSFGNIGWAEPQFRSCADIKLTTVGTKSAAPKCPSFVGGDRVSKLENKGTDQCFYFYTNDIVNSQYKGSNTDYEKNYKFGIPAPVQKCGGGASSPSTSGNSTASSSDNEDADNDAAEELTPAATTKAPTPAATAKAPSSSPSKGKTPKPRKTHKPRKTRRTPKPSKGSTVAGEADTAATPAPSKVVNCKTKSAK